MLLGVSIAGDFVIEAPFDGCRATAASAAASEVCFVPIVFICDGDVCRGREAAESCLDIFGSNQRLKDGPAVVCLRN